MSKGADNLKEILKALYGEHSNIILEHLLPGNLRLDYYMPVLNLAFEFHGRQHTEFVAHFHKDRLGFEDSKWRDEQKSLLCHKMGIVLVHFWDGDEITAESVSFRIAQAIDSFVPYKGDEFKTSKQQAKDKASAYRKAAYKRMKEFKKNARKV